MTKITIDFERHEQTLDQKGLVFLFQTGHTSIGTIRYVPLGEDLTLIEKIRVMGNYHHLDIADAWEVGRLVLLPDYRSLSILKKCCGDTIDWLTRHTTIKVMWGACDPKLVPLYTRMGFERVSDKIIMPGSPGKTFVLIQGKMDKVIEKLLTPPGQQ